MVSHEIFHVKLGFVGRFHSLNLRLAGIVRFGSCTFGFCLTDLLNPSVVVIHMCLGLKTYKAHIRGVFPRCGIEQIREAKAKVHELKQTIPTNWGLRL